MSSVKERFLKYVQVETTSCEANDCCPSTPGQKVLIVDDLIATGGTTEAMIKLVQSLGGEVVGVVVLMELAGLKGRERIKGYPLYSAITYEGK